MKERLRDSLFRLYLGLFYRITRVEYIRFAFHNEYLITYWKRRFPFFKSEEFLCEISLGYRYGRFFTTRVEELKKSRVPFEQKELTLQELTSYATGHNVLKNDPFIEKRLQAILAGVAIR